MSGSASTQAPPRPSAGVRFSALLVNFNSGAFAVGCVESLRAEWARDGRAPEDLEVIVVDNASPHDQTEWLSALEAGGATVVRSDANGGYAAGMNQALARSSGGPRDVVGILNPDLCFLPGSIGTLLDYLAEHPECGAIDPKATIDPDLGMHLPPNELPSVREQAYSVMAQLHPRLCRAYSRHRVRFAHPWWFSKEPITARMLSGCCILLRREVVAKLPALMDERYPLYYEDADLCRSLRGLGYQLVHHTGARVLHHWSRSSGVGEQFQGEPMRRYWISQRAYFEKFYGPLGSGAVAAVNWLARKWPASKSFRPMHEVQSLGVFTEPIEIPLPRRARFCMELALAPTWILAVGIFGDGERWVCTPRMWEWMFQADYFMRAIDLDTGEVLGAWHFQKGVPGRNHPLSLAEIEALAPLPEPRAARSVAT